MRMNVCEGGDGESPDFGSDQEDTARDKEGLIQFKLPDDVSLSIAALANHHSCSGVLIDLLILIGG